MEKTQSCCREYAQQIGSFFCMWISLNGLYLYWIIVWEYVCGLAPPMFFSNAQGNFLLRETINNVLSYLIIMCINYNNAVLIVEVVPMIPFSQVNYYLYITNHSFTSVVFTIQHFFFIDLENKLSFNWKIDRCFVHRVEQYSKITVCKNWMTRLYSKVKKPCLKIVLSSL